MIRLVGVQDHANVFQIGLRNVGQHSGNGGAVHSLNELIVKTSHLDGGAGAFRDNYIQGIGLHIGNTSAGQIDGLSQKSPIIFADRNSEGSAVCVIGAIDVHRGLQIIGIVVDRGSNVLQLAVLVVQVSPGNFHSNGGTGNSALVVAQRERGQVVHSVDRNGPFGGNVLRSGHHGKLLLVIIDGNGVLTKIIGGRDSNTRFPVTSRSISSNRSAVLGLYGELSRIVKVLRNGQAYHLAGVVDLHLIDALALVGVLQIGGSRRYNLIQHYSVVLIVRAIGNPQGQFIPFLGFSGPTLTEVYSGGLIGTIIHDRLGSSGARLDNIQVGSHMTSHTHAAILGAQLHIRSVVRHIGLERAVLCIDGNVVNVELCEVRQFCRSSSAERNHCDDQHHCQKHRK